MLIALRLALFLLAGTAMLSYLGYAPARLLVRDALRPARLFLLPPLGFCVLAVGASFLNYVLPMPGVLLVLALLATAANAWLVRRDHGAALDRPSRHELAVLMLAVLAFAAAGIPQVHANTLAFLGVQWDLEIYLPLGEYLKHYAMGGALQAYPNPLLDMMNDPAVRGGSGWGFMYLDAAMGSLLGWGSFETFRPLLHFVFALSAPAVYSLCRWGLRMGPGGSLTAAALTAVNGLNLWVAAIGLGGHDVAFVLLPVTLLFVLWTLRIPDLRNATLTGLAVTGLLMSFYTGAAAVLAAVIAPVGLLGLARSPQRVRLLLMVAAALGVLLVAGLIAHLRFATVLPLYFRDGPSEGWKVAEFVSLSQAFGLLPYVLVQQRLPNDPFLPLVPTVVLAVWGTLLSLAAVGLCALAARNRQWERWYWLAGLAGLAVFAVLLRYVAPYPYGYFKVFSLGFFLLAAGAGQGFATLAGGGWLPRRVTTLLPMLPRLSRGVAALTAVALLPLAIANIGQSLRYYWQVDPDELPRQVWELQALHQKLPAGAPVYVTGRSGFDPRFGAMVGYFLMDNPIVGNLASAYGKVRSARPDEAFDYLLFQASERPDEAGVSEGDLVWRNDLVAVYRRPAAWVASADLETVNGALPLSPQPLEVGVRADGWVLGSGATAYQGATARPAARQQVELTLLAIDDATATVTEGGASRPLMLPGGLITYRSAAMPTPATLSLATAASSPQVRLLGLRVLDATEASAAPGVRTASDLMVLQQQPTVTGNLATLDVDFHANDSHSGYSALSLEVYRKGSSALAPAGFWQLATAKRRETNSVHWQGDLTDARCGAEGPRQVRPEGDYEAHLAVYHVNEEVYRKRWLRFSIVNGEVANVRRENLSPYTVQYLGTPREVTALGRVVPAGATVYLPGGEDPDQSFLRVAAAELGDRRFTADLATTSAPDFALVPIGTDLARLGLAGATPAWRGSAAELYPLADRMAALLPLSPPLQLAPEAAIHMAVGERLTVTSSGVAVTQPMRRPTADATLVVEGIASGPGVLTFSSRAVPPVELSAGAFRYEFDLANPERSYDVTLVGKGAQPVRITAVAVLNRRASEPALTLAPEAGVTARTANRDGLAEVAVDWFGAAADDTVLGLDVYEMASCSPMHYGWWAAPMSAVGRTPTFVLSPAQQSAQVSGNPTAQLASQTWPPKDGSYRGFVMIKQGEAFDSVPAFEFRLKGGRLRDLTGFTTTRRIEVKP